MEKDKPIGLNTYSLSADQLTSHQSTGSPACSGLSVEDLFTSESADAALSLRSVLKKGDKQASYVIENLKISGDALMGRIIDLIKQGNVRRIAIKNREGHTLLSLPTCASSEEVSLSCIPSSEAMAIQVISAIVAYPKIIVEKLV